MFEFQYQYCTKWWRHQWLRLNLLRPKAFLAFMPKAFKPSLTNFGWRSQKLFMFKFQYLNGNKRESGKIFSELQNWTTRGSKIGESYRDYKSWQEWLKMEAALEISNRAKHITNRGRDFKSGQRDFKSG